MRKPTEKLTRADQTDADKIIEAWKSGEHHQASLQLSLFMPAADDPWRFVAYVGDALGDVAMQFMEDASAKRVQALEARLKKN
jgi:hypothetical protein